MVSQTLCLKREQSVGYRDQWCCQNFIISMWSIKFWKRNLNLRSVYKICFSKYWAVSCIFDLQKGSLSLLRDENYIFSLNRSNRVTKNPSFHTGFVKSAPKKVHRPSIFYAIHLGVKITAPLIYRGSLHQQQWSYHVRIGFAFPVS